MLPAAAAAAVGEVEKQTSPSPRAKEWLSRFSSKPSGMRLLWRWGKKKWRQRRSERRWWWRETACTTARPRTLTPTAACPKPWESGSPALVASAAPHSPPPIRRRRRRRCCFAGCFRGVCAPSLLLLMVRGGLWWGRRREARAWLGKGRAAGQKTRGGRKRCFSTTSGPSLRCSLLSRRRRRLKKKQQLLRRPLSWEAAAAAAVWWLGGLLSRQAL
mmetsp:Transcript_62783/g.123368  ORF Transcript_62783/g.123368 Transcript_62783/m.123368 type:complete len:216 (-) Transcript_62783:274-921(-)